MNISLTIKATYSRYKYLTNMYTSSQADDCKLQNWKKFTNLHAYRDMLSTWMLKKASMKWLMFQK